jgi:hypothetical protein
VRWELLFADLEAQATAIETAERSGEVDERARIELGRLRLVERLRPAVGLEVRVSCPAAVTVAGALRRTGAQWLLIDERGGRQALVVLTAVMSVTGTGRRSAASGSMDRIESRLGLTHALRGIAHDRSTVRIDLIDGSSLDGTIDRVGADYLELALHGPGEARRRSEVRELAVVALTALAVVRRQGG